MGYPLPNAVAVASLSPKIIDGYGVTQNKPSLVVFDFNFSTEQQYNISLTVLQMQQTFGVPRSIYINNSSNPNGVTVYCGGTAEVLLVPAFTIGMLPISALANDTISLYSLGGASGTVHVEIYNYERSPYTYGGLAPFQPGANVQAVTPAAATLINRNTTLSAGVAANVFPTVSTARNVRFRNIGDGAGGGDVAWYNVGATATGTFASGDMLIQPGDPEIVMPYRTASRISFFSVAGTRISAEEWTV